LSFPLMGVAYDNEMRVLVGKWVGGWICGRVRADSDVQRRRYQPVILVQQVPQGMLIPTNNSVCVCVWRVHFTIFTKHPY
jgi:hypothetical protein